MYDLPVAISALLFPFLSTTARVCAKKSNLLVRLTLACRGIMESFISAMVLAAQINVL